MSGVLFLLSSGAHRNVVETQCGGNKLSARVKNRQLFIIYLYPTIFQKDRKKRISSVGLINIFITKIYLFTICIKKDTQE